MPISPHADAEGWSAMGTEAIGGSGYLGTFKAADVMGQEVVCLNGLVKASVLHAAERELGPAKLAAKSLASSICKLATISTSADDA